MAKSFLGLSSTALKKYRSLIISLIFLILLAITSILASLYLSSVYNKAFGRYSAISRAVELHHDLIIALQATADTTNPADERVRTANIAGETYEQLKEFYPAFITGGTVTPDEHITGAEAKQTSFHIPAPLDEEDAQQAIDLQTKTNKNLLLPFEKTFEALHHATAETFTSNNLDSDIKSITEAEIINWEKGFVLFNSIKSSLQARADRIDQINKYLTLGSILVLLTYFAAIGLSNLRRLVKSDEEIEQARRETDDIMKNVNTGLFLLDKDLNIGNQYSAQLENIIGETKVSGQNLTGLLNNKVSAKDLETTQSFVKQLYNPRVKEKLVDDLNPLRKIMVNDGKNQSRFLDFKFSRVYDKNEIEKILVNVQDVTQQVRLEQRLEQERAQNDLQIEMLTTILNVNPTIINEFINNTHENIIKINNILKSPGSQQAELQEKLNGMYRIMHSLKGEASTLKLHSFITIASNFEEILKELQNKPKLSGNDFLPLTIHLDEMLNLSNTIESLGARINQGVAMAAPSAIPATNPQANIQPTTQSQPIDVPSDAAATSFTLDMTPQPVVTPIASVMTGRNQLYQQFADSIAIRQSKEVNLKATGFNEVMLSRELEAGIKEIVIQLIRNSVVHGIEMPEVRRAAGKSEVGNIKVNLMELSENYKLTIEDDGQGINYNAIRAKAVQMGYDTNEIQEWDKNKLLGLLFKSGFSTKDTADEDAGRGVGMDIIKARVQELHGHLAIDTQVGQYTRFVIKIPKSIEE